MKKNLTVPASETLAAFNSASQTAPKPNEQMQAVLDQLQKLGGKPIESLTPEEARKQPSPADAVKALLQSQGKSIAAEPVASVKNQTIRGDGGKIPIRIYTPKGDGPFPVILYIHGGGWVIADLDTYDSTPRALANAAEAVVVSTHYRLAPEHPFPAAHEDACTAYEWVLEKAWSFNGDVNRVAVAGESAGGNMAAAICLMAQEQDIPMPVHQLLIYPVVGTDTTTPSFKENANAKPLNGAMMEWFGKHALKNSQDKLDAHIDLAKADLHGLPPTTVITAEIDPLRSGGQLLVAKLKANGVPVKYKNYEGVTHEFFGMGAVLDEAKNAVEFAAEDLKESFSLVEPREKVLIH